MEKHITLVTNGTRGDVEPFLALAYTLLNTGYTLTIVAPLDFKELIIGSGFTYLPLGSQRIKDLLQDLQLQGMLDLNFTTLKRAMSYFKTTMYEINLESLPAALQETDMIIAHASLPAASDLAEAHVWRSRDGVPLIYLSTVPLTPTHTMASVMFSEGNWLLNVRFMRRFYNWFTHLPVRFTRFFYADLYRQLRRKLNLPAQSRFQQPFYLKDRPVPMVHIYSPALVPRPDDWPEHAYISGYLFNDQSEKDFEPSDGLKAFLEAGEPPVYIGFGSMIPGDVPTLARIVTDAVKLARKNSAGFRAIVSSGWAGLLPECDDVAIYQVGSVPHHWLFPHCSAVVHHGGAGTTAAGLRAGCPTLICPVSFDQPFWGRVIHKRGLGPSPIRLKELIKQPDQAAELLAAAMVELTANPEYRQNAHVIAEQIGAERPMDIILSLIKNSI